MQISDVLPGGALAVLVTAALGVSQVTPTGIGMLLVRVRGDAVAAALIGAAQADAAFVGVPAPGFALVYGDGSKVRAAFGAAVRWNGRAQCSPAS